MKGEGPIACGGGRANHVSLVRGSATTESCGAGYRSLGLQSRGVGGHRRRHCCILTSCSVAAFHVSVPVRQSSRLLTWARVYMIGNNDI